MIDKLNIPIGNKLTKIIDYKFWLDDSEWWYKYEYDEVGNKTYSETSSGEWYKYEYDTRGNIIYFENYRGYWSKEEYDKWGNLIYLETSKGIIKDDR